MLKLALMTDAPGNIVTRLPEMLVLWDVDHTLIENGGVSKATYARAFELLTGQKPSVRPTTDGRTDFQIMKELLAANSVDPDEYADTAVLTDVLGKAMEQNAPDLPERGYILKCVSAALAALSDVPGVVQSVLTGNVASNARAKLAAFGLDSLLDLDVGGYGSYDIVRSKLVDVARAKVAQKYGVTFDQTSTVLVGDTERDVQAAYDDGAKVVAVTTGVYAVDQLTEAGAAVTLEDLGDLDAFIRALVAVRAADTLG